MGADAEVPVQLAYPSPGVAPTSCSAGPATAIEIPCDDESQPACPSWSTPPTVSTLGMVAGAPTCTRPLPRFPAAATIRTSFSSA